MEQPGKVGLYDPANEKDACGVGFIADLNHRPTHNTVSDALEMLMRMEHRGACGCDENTGDGAGILLNMPHSFFKACLAEKGVDLPAPKHYAVAQLFLHRKKSIRQELKEAFAKVVADHNMQILCWRDVPVDNTGLGDQALLGEPVMEQAFIVPSTPFKDSAEARQFFKPNLYLVMKRCHAPVHEILSRDNYTPKTSEFYFASMSADTIVYKGQLTAVQVSDYFLDLINKDFTSDLALVHSRFSTNTFPSWDRAQPYRSMCHNGEINTLRGNVNWMRARQGLIKCEGLGLEEGGLRSIMPVVEEGQSDSGVFNSVLELLTSSGRPLPEAMMMMIPEAWQNDKAMNSEKRDYYRFMSCLMEPWDGPALMAFTDGRYMGATLDRNGLRPGRFYETTDGRVIMGSEFGVVDVDPAIVKKKGRLCPGKMLLVDFDKGRVVEDQELKSMFTSSRPYKQWLKKHMLTLEDFVSEASTERATRLTGKSTLANMKQSLTMYGWTRESVDILLVPMFRDAAEALGSMGNDAPLACLSERPRITYEFFKQLFAQVTNPPLDSTREYIVMSLECMVGPMGDITSTKEEQAGRLCLKSPMLREHELQGLMNTEVRGWKAKQLDASYPVSEGPEGLARAIERLKLEAEQAVAAGYSIIVITDRHAGKDRVPVSTLAACGALHHHLVSTEQRLLVALIVDTGEAREVHHFCVLVGFGADAICPRTALAVIHRLVKDPSLPRHSDGTRYTGYQLVARYFQAVHKGMLKVMAKMGISTLQSYKGAQIFECVGLSNEIVDVCFVNTASRIGGLDFADLGRNYLRMHAMAYDPLSLRSSILHNPGDYHYRSNTGSERHLNDPEAIAKLQEASRLNSVKAYEDYARIINDINKHTTIRGLMDFKSGEYNGGSIPVDQVESAASIVKRFSSGAMSYGSISYEAHSTLAVAMNRIGAKSNTGEGGEAPDRLKKTASGENNPMRSAIKQVASGRFGVTSQYLSNADELQIKMAQGAKPGEGGELPGHKVVGPIADVRHSTPGVGLISPPPHHDIYSIEDLKELIFDLKNSNPSARISVKLVSECGVGVIASGVCKALADHVLISGHDGGTGASRWTGIKHAGLPWELGLAETHQTLVLNDLRRRIVVQTDGQLKTGRDLAVACLLGAEEFCMATAPLIALGCIMMRACHRNTCPVGIATQDPELRRKFAGQPEHVINFMFMMAEEMRKYMAQMGFRTVSEMVGRADMLEANKELMKQSPDYAKLDLSALLTPAHELRPDVPQRCVESQDHKLELTLDRELINRCRRTLQNTAVQSFFEIKVRNTHRSVGTMLSHVVTKTHGELEDNSIYIRFTGSAGQSFGAWVCKGITMELVGDANDYVAKGLCGGRLIVQPPLNSLFIAEDNILLGNVALYGATSGQVFLRGRAAERFCVRNSGATAVVEGVGDHCCEYMTGGRAVILGPTGRNFGAGMSGGIAYVYDPNSEFPPKCNKEMVFLEGVEAEEDEIELLSLIQQHVRYTRSEVGRELLANWDSAVSDFVKVFPIDYKRALETQRLQEEGANETRVRARLKQSGGRRVRSKSSERHDPLKLDYKEANKEAGTDIEEIPLTPNTKNTKADDLTSSLKLEDQLPSVAEKPSKRRGFVEYERGVIGYRSPAARLEDWKEITNPMNNLPKQKLLKTQTARCMDCGVPFCHQKKTGCPLGNRIPEWNELVYKGEWREALDALLATNNFPEFTGRVCPAPCEGACVLGIIAKPVAIKNVECAIIDRGFQEGWIRPDPPKVRTGKSVAIVGSGPAGLAAADQLNKSGHTVTVYERADRVGGLMMYGVPNMKADKEGVVQRRVNLMKDEGISFVTGVEIGKELKVEKLRADNDALVLACGATVPRDLPIDGRDAKGVHFAMEFLTKNTKSLLDSKLEDGQFINVKGKNVIVIGGGDTGNDCIGTSMRHGAKSVVNFELLPMPAAQRAADNPWPQWPRVFRVDYGHEEVAHAHGADPREFGILSKEFVKDAAGNLTGIRTVKVDWQKDDNGRWQMSEIPDSEKTYEADFAFLSMGFLGPEKTCSEPLALELDGRGNYKAAPSDYATSEAGVFAAGDCRRGQSLVVWAIAEGRGVAASVNKYLQPVEAQAEAEGAEAAPVTADYV